MWLQRLTGLIDLQARRRRYADDTDIVVGVRANDAGDAGAVPVGLERAHVVINEVARRGDPADQIRMAQFHPGVDDGHANALAARPLLRRAGLDGGKALL